MNAFLLDTSALVAHYFHKPGAEDVVKIFSDADAVVRLCALSLTELNSALAAHGVEPETRRNVVEAYRGMASEVTSVTAELAVRAAEIKDATKPRLPLVDAVIAACASGTGSTLVHCDTHFLGIPGKLLKQMPVPA